MKDVLPALAACFGKQSGRSFRSLPIGLLAAALALPLASAVGTAEEIVAKGDGFQVTLEELRERYDLHHANLAARGERIKDHKRADVVHSLLDKLVTHRALRQKAAEADIEAAKQSASDTLMELKKQARSEASYRRQLLAVGMNERQFMLHLLENAINEAVIGRELGASIEIPDDAVKRFWESNPDTFRIPDRARVRHILFSKRGPDRQPLPDFEIQAKRESAETVARRARLGESFTALVRAHSEDVKTRDNGGELTFSQEQVLPAFAAAVFSMTPGQISDAVETDNGFHIIRLEETWPAREISLEEAREQIVAYLKNEELARRLPAYLERVKREARVEMSVDPSRF